MIGSDAPASVATTVTCDRVRAVIEEHVLPYVRNHGGDLQVTAVAEDGTVTCRLDRACRGCPAAPVTVIAVLERALRAHLSDNIRVQAPQIAISPAAMERIRHFYPDRVTARQRSDR